MPTDFEASNIELEQEEKTAYEMMHGFCILYIIWNMTIKIIELLESYVWLN